jgi:hypothetical protein
LSNIIELLGKDGEKITSLQDFCDGSKLGQRISQCNPNFKTPFPTPTTTFQKLTNARAIFNLIESCYPYSHNLFSPYSFIDGTSVLIGTCYKLILCWNSIQFSSFSSLYSNDDMEEFMNDETELQRHDSQLCYCHTTQCPNCQIKVKYCCFEEHIELVCHVSKKVTCPFCLEITITDRIELSKHMKICDKNILGAFKESGGVEYAKFIEFNKQVKEWIKNPFKLCPWYNYWKIAHESKFDKEESICLDYLSKEVIFIQKIKDIMKSKNYRSNMSGIMKDISIHFINSSFDIKSLMNLSLVCRDYYLLSIRSNLWEKFYLDEIKKDDEKRNENILINYKEEIELKWKYIFAQYLNRVKVCISLFDFEAVLESDLTLKSGGIYRILNEDESGWWTAETTSGERGEIPSNYITFETENVKYQDYNSLDFYEGCYYIAKYKFIPENDDELRMEKGDIFLIITLRKQDNWLYAENCFGVKGLIPSNYMAYI